MIIAILGLSATAAQSAGFKKFLVPADADGPALEAAMWSPCAANAKDIKLGRYVLPAALDCPIVGQNLPLIVVSHGFGGTYLGHHDTAEALADAGFIAVAINHSGDSFANEARFRDFSALVSRPSDIRRLIDFMVGPASDSSKIDSNRIGFFGFSRGGYTGLVLSGGQPDFHALRCINPDAERCARRIAEISSVQNLVHDARIKAIVIADPLSSMFPTRESLKTISVPVQLWGSQLGGDGVSPEDVANVAQNLPGQPQFHIVPQAAHFAFLPPCDEERKRSSPEICIDGANFDRAAFHKDFNQRVLAFFQQHLGAGERP
ncbi:alpha/beta hydrolase family protein [Methylobacterium radiotolerans]|uniref:alpha/beta hydrolase family protein n=1 Tax=Methylobacterium radiotolerans TaxID=31998 RepID=UPI001FCF209C|nr:dienelactone hydrolase [Methylobacterium radiotolerans]